MNDVTRAPGSSSNKPTGWLHDDTYLKHLPGRTGHPECPERLLAIRDRIQKAPWFPALSHIAPRMATPRELSLVHDPHYLALVAREATGVSGLRQLSTGDTIVSRDSLVVAYLAAGGVLAATDAVMTGKLRNAFCAVRPPGHHATRDRAMGFCIFNNVALAARYVQQTFGITKVLIVDWDYHHGNGTQDIFYDDPTVFYFSTHHYGAYPGTGAPSERGIGDGVGATLNVPLPVGCSDAQIYQALDSCLVPAAQAFHPEFVFISAGFDAMRDDLLGCFDVTPEGFAAITRLVTNLAEELCGGRIVSVLEGGYRLDGLAECAAAHVEALQSN
ncbi:MAG: histone deacetylase [Acidobacteria bacterium]|nr:histone deacetylase [Acidobacteriota bacterium]